MVITLLYYQVVRDKRTAKSKGYGFVCFANPRDLVAALKKMNGGYTTCYFIQVLVTQICILTHFVMTFFLLYNHCSQVCLATVQSNYERATRRTGEILRLWRGKRLTLKITAEVLLATNTIAYMLIMHLWFCSFQNHIQKKPKPSKKSILHKWFL